MFEAMLWKIFWFTIIPGIIAVWMWSKCEKPFNWKAEDHKRQNLEWRK